MKNHGMNPYLPSWEYVPDGEPHVFGKRVYIYGSHDRFAGYAFCQNDYVCWSAPVDDLTDWQYEGIIYTRAEAAHNEDGRQCLYAPDVTCGPDGRYYLYYALNETSAISVAVCDTPAGKYTYYGDYQNKVCVVTGAASGIGKALCEKLVALGAQVYALDRNKADIEGLSAFVETDLSDKGSIDAAFGVLPQVIDRFFGVAGLSGARTSYWLTFTVNFIANKYMTDTYLEKRIPSGGSIAYVTSCGGLMWEKWRKEYVKVMDCKTWDEMVAFMKSVSPKDGVGVMAYTLSKRAMNYYTSLKAVELGKRGIRVNALLPGSTDTGMKKEFEKMAGGQDNLVKENGGAGRLATPQEMADPLLFLNSDMAAFVSGLLLIADMGHNCEKTLGFCKNQLDVPAALRLYNTKFFQNKLKTNQ